MKYTRIIIAGVLLLSNLGAGAQVVLTKSSKPIARIIVEENHSANDADNAAALILQRFVKESSGATLPLLHGVTPRKGDIIIGRSDKEALTEDGFRLRTQDGTLRISSGGDKGSLHGVITLLERYLGMDYFAANVYTIDKKQTITLPEMNFYENPAFRYRQSQAYGLKQDSLYRMFMRLEEPGDIFADKLWVHTFNHLMPASVYGDTHPEYYSFINGERRPGRASQWCLTNPDVLEIAAARIDSIFKANPGKNIISVSQNDSNFTFCRCDECEKVNIEEGAPSGNYVRFLNKLAQRFPDKEFSTLAYLFTMKPPKHVKPLPNVNIMLCDIDCDREVSLTENASGREFVEAIEGWSAISNNIFVWDYGINFDNMVAPFPNFPILKPNIELFKKNHATMHFSQIGGSFGGDFSEMRAWVVSKLMWNPEQNTDSLMWRFMKGYYGNAAPYIYQYEKLLEGALLASGERLWIYDSPVTHKNGMLNAACRKRYGALFDSAEAAVAADSALLRRVRLSRLPLIYSNLEIARTMIDKNLTLVMSELETFERYVTQYGVQTLNERNNAPQEYCQLYRQRYMPSKVQNLALGAKVNWITEPANSYKQAGEKTLTDGLFGGASYVDSWTGWEGRDGAFTLELDGEKEITTIEADFLHQLGSWILLPRSVTYSVSMDGTNYTPFGHVEIAEDQSVPVKFSAATATTSSPIKARYVKVEIESVKQCPSWHYGIGSPCWFFIDEVSVR